MKIDAVCIGHATVIDGKKAKTGIVKHPQSGTVIVDTAGLAGDAVCNRKYHGGPDQAVYGLGSLDLAAWADELGQTVEPGLFGENIVISEIDSRTIAVGDRFETDGVALEVTSTRIPLLDAVAAAGRSRFRPQVPHVGPARLLLPRVAAGHAQRGRYRHLSAFPRLQDHDAGHAQGLGQKPVGRGASPLPCGPDQRARPRPAGCRRALTIS